MGDEPINVGCLAALVVSVLLWVILIIVIVWLV